MTLPAPPPADDDQPEMEPIEPEAQEDSTVSGKDESEDQPLTPEDLDEFEALIRDDPETIETHRAKLTVRLVEVKKYEQPNASPSELARADKAYAEIYKCYMRNLKDKARRMLYGTRKGGRRLHLVEGGIHDDQDLLYKAFGRLLKLMVGKFRFKNRKVFFSMAARMLNRVVLDALRKRKRRYDLMGGRLKKAKGGQLRGDREVEIGEENRLRLGKRDGDGADDKSYDTKLEEIHRLDLVIKFLKSASVVERKYFDVYFRHEYHSQSFQSIADDLNIGRSTAHEWYHNARRQILKLPKEDA